MTLPEAYHCTRDYLLHRMVYRVPNDQYTAHIFISTQRSLWGVSCDPDAQDAGLWAWLLGRGEARARDLGWP